MGLSVGRSIVGNMGSDTMKKLCDVGNAPNALERFARTIVQNYCFLEKRLDGIDEWMYEMSERKQTDPFHLLNEAMAKYLSGDCSREASASPLAIPRGITTRGSRSARLAPLVHPLRRVAAGHKRRGHESRDI